ncbi:MAG TPA: hypothetical protein PLC40_14345, partial [Candidatus Hydrogenedentes bacterium]|nr:hypothetical protein [Candidatus Hydrogenedentota bacterium]
VILNGNEFLENKPQVKIGPKVERAIVTGNLVNGEIRVVSEAPRGRTVVENNLGSPRDRKFVEGLKRRRDFRSGRLRN